VATTQQWTVTMNFRALAPRVLYDMAAEEEPLLCVCYEINGGAFSGQVLDSVTIVTNYTIDYSLIDMIFVDNTSADITVTLPAGHTDHTYVTVKQIYGDMLVHSLTVVTSDGAAIEMGPSYSFTEDLESITFHSDGTNWWIV